MDIRTIIRNDAERLLTVDRECCLIYTGDTPGEPRPFIRIGTWKGMPPALVPMIDTIILPEGLVGNPAHECLNMDVRDPRNNHYIGLSHTIRGFVEFQRFMGIDTDDISVTIVEKDLPAMPGGIPQVPGDDYIGVFTRDGNVALAREGRTIFDLRSLRECPLRPESFMTLMSGRFSKSGRYAGSGLLFAGGAPFFYSGGSLVAVSPPAECLEELSRLCVDPGAVTTFIDINGRLDGIAQFMKWRDMEGGSISIYGDSGGLTALAGLFPGCSQDIRPFTGMDHEAGGIGLRGHRGDPGLRVSFNAPHAHVTAALVTDVRHATEIIKKPPDLVLVPALSFESLNLVLRGSGCPVAVFDDGSPVASKIHTRGITVLSGGMQYEIVRPENRAALERLCGLAPGIADKLRRGETVPDDELAATTAPAGRNGALMNAIAVLKNEIDTITDRTASMRLTALLDILGNRFDRRAFRAEAHSLKVLLCVLGGSLYQVAAPVESAGAAYVIDSVGSLSRHDRDRLPPEVILWHDRILSDRERLSALMRLHAHSVAAGSAAPAEGAGPAKHAGIPGQTPVPARKLLSRGKIFRTAVIVIAAVAAISGGIAAFLLGSGRPAARHRETPVIESSELDKKWGMQNDLYDVSVDDFEIYRYANRVAVDNGYLKIAPYRFKEKNPAWIYPDTVFVLPDGQKVRISGGDTLWNLSRNKLIEAAVLFDRAMREAQKTPRGKKREELFDRAERYALTEDRRVRLSIARGTPLKKGRGGK